MIIVITTQEQGRDGRLKTVVSHGVDATTGRNIVMSCDDPRELGAVFDRDIGEYVIREPGDRPEQDDPPAPR